MLLNKVFIIGFFTESDVCAVYTISLQIESFCKLAQTLYWYRNLDLFQFRMPSAAFKRGTANHKSMHTENKCSYTVVNEILNG